MASFGQLLRIHRRQCSDPLRGGSLTQERLGELLGETLGDDGYSGAAPDMGAVISGRATPSWGAP